MFDRKVIHTGPSHVTHTHQTHTEVVEKRAPTDESVRLLREMEAAARESVVEVWLGKAGDNSLAALDITMDAASYERVVAFKLNGEMYRVRIDENDVRSSAQTVVDSMAKVIAAEIFVRGQWKPTRRLPKDPA